MEVEQRLSAVSADASRPAAPVCGSQGRMKGGAGGRAGEGPQVTGPAEEVESQREVVWSSRGQAEDNEP